MGKLGPYNQNEVLAAIELAGGNISAAARMLDRRRVSLKTYIDRQPKVSQLLNDLRDDMLDHAEWNFYRATKMGDLGASKFVLQTLGRDRGYALHQEHTGPDGGPLRVEYDARKLVLARLDAITNHDPD